MIERRAGAEPLTPDLFLIGFPKCGTTSLARLLGSTEGVCMSASKEPHFFAPEQDAVRVTRSESEYRAQFDRAGPGDLLFEASTLYAYSEQAIDAILRRRRDARFVVCLRDPARMALSLHGHALREGYEDVAEPAEAWRLQSERARGRRLPQTGIHRPEVLRYEYMSSLGDHFADRLAQIPARQLFACFLEDLQRNESDVLTLLAGFLGLEPDSLPPMTRENPGRLYRWRGVRTLAARLERSAPTRLVKARLRNTMVRDLYRRAVFTPLPTQRTRESAEYAALVAPHRRSQLDKIARVARTAGLERVYQTATALRSVTDDPVISPRHD